MTAYLSLIYPGPESRYEPVTPDSIVLCGDSAGGNLCLALVQAILQMRRLQEDPLPQVIFNGKKVSIPLPCGMSLLSPWVDLSLSLPSNAENVSIDWLGESLPAIRHTSPADDVWPSHPPRADPYCDASAMVHPLVSPVTALDWTGMPPLWVSCGQERLVEGMKLLATRSVHQGASVTFCEYRGLPHIFPIMLGKLPQSARCYAEWAQSCLRPASASRVAHNSGIIIDLPGDNVNTVDVGKISNISHEEARSAIHKTAQQRAPWTGPTATHQTRL